MAFDAYIDINVMYFELFCSKWSKRREIYLPHGIAGKSLAKRKRVMKIHS